MAVIKSQWAWWRGGERDGLGLLPVLFQLYGVMLSCQLPSFLFYSLDLHCFCLNVQLFVRTPFVLTCYNYLFYDMELKGLWTTVYVIIAGSLIEIMR